MNKVQSPIWAKDTQANETVATFTVGRDAEFDTMLARADVLGNLAHTRMLASINLLTQEELAQVQQGLKEIYTDIENGRFEIEAGVEDVHSQVELLLTRKYGDVGKKIHSGRSRNDQILLDLKLFIREEIIHTLRTVETLFAQLQTLSEAHKKTLMPGYTHLQIAMPSSFGLWFGCYAESLTDDLQLLLAAYKITNQNPLGSAAGYGSSFPLNRSMTTELLGFENLNYNVMYAQMGRGKVEKITSYALASIASTLAKMAMEMCLFMNQNFGFVSFPEELTTGSSIMPHKKNPDVFELIRAKCNRLQALPTEITFITTNLPFGYNRDLQIIKEHFLPAFAELQSCMELTMLMFANIRIAPDILHSPLYDYLFSVDEVNRLVQQGVPFRDAYKQVGREINEGKFNPVKTAEHTHEGSIGNLCSTEIARKCAAIVAQFEWEKTEKQLKQLLVVNY
ncbi:MAG: argininosuccinate lyase [Bacteroidales bacterium]|jgi:argininosuccinate lyase|nr:argininosuccinate lyase [Bacteroidales bacterium]